MNQFSFERLDVWQDSRDLAKNIYIATKEFPENKKSPLSSALKVYFVNRSTERLIAERTLKRTVISLTVTTGSGRSGRRVGGHSCHHHQGNSVIEFYSYYFRFYILFFESHSSVCNLKSGTFVKDQLQK